MLSFIFKTMSKQAKQNLFMKLVSSDTNVSSKSFFLVVTTIVGVLLLAVPIIGILTDVYFNHTITVDMSGIATYIGAVAGVFASAGITKAWSEYSENKFGKYRKPQAEETATED